MAWNNRYKDRNGEQVEDTSFFDVTCWRDLADNVAESISKGDRVIVYGKLEQRSWETQEGEKRSKVEIVADEVAPSLRWATAQVDKIRRDGPSGGGGGGGSASRAAPQRTPRLRRRRGALLMARPRTTKNKDNARRSKKRISILTQEKVTYVDYKDVNLLRRFQSDRAKIRARRVTGNSTQQQAEVAMAIKNAREMALLPYTSRVTQQRGGGRGRDGDRRGRDDDRDDRDDDRDYDDDPMRRARRRDARRHRRPSATERRPSDDRGGRRMKVILRTDVDQVGKRGDLVDVSDGHARNHLIPKGLAMRATPEAEAQAAHMRKAREVARHQGGRGRPGGRHQARAPGHPHHGQGGRGRPPVRVGARGRHRGRGQGADRGRARPQGHRHRRAHQDRGHALRDGQAPPRGAVPHHHRGRGAD